ncbi:MAG: hypothetical protein AB7N80_15050 [Bdellovibrionales bacterium]
MNLNQKILTTCLYFIVVTYTCNGSASTQVSQSLDKVLVTKTLAPIDSSWKELLLQFARRNEWTIRLVNHIEKYSKSADWNSLMCEIREASQVAISFTGGPEAIKNSEAYLRLHQAEIKLAAAFTKLPSADELKNSNYIDFRVILESIETRIYVEKFRLTRLMMQKDACLATTDYTSDIEKFCSAVKIDLEKGGCTTNYQPLVMGDICRSTN